MVVVRLPRPMEGNGVTVVVVYWKEKGYISIFLNKLYESCSYYVYPIVIYKYMFLYPFSCTYSVIIKGKA